jgi:hypothetical protein
MLFTLRARLATLATSAAAAIAVLPSAAPAQTRGTTSAATSQSQDTAAGDIPALQRFIVTPRLFSSGVRRSVVEQSAPTIAWRDGKTRISFDAAYLEISSRVQVRFTEELPDDRTTLPGTGGAGEGRGSFRIRRAKFKLEGWMLQPWLTFETQVNYPAVAGSNAGALLEDAAFDIDFTHGEGRVRVHVGQFKPPYGAQEMTSSGSQMFVDRALVSNSFFRGREIGVAAWGVTPDNRLEWRVGMFNGNGQTRTANDNDQFQYNARLMWQPTGRVPLHQRGWISGPLYSESDFESGEAPIYAFGVNVERQNNFNATTGNDLKWTAFSIDGIYKFRGLFANGMFALAQRTPEAGASFDAAGGFVQVGQLFGGRRYEVAFRYGQFDPSDVVDRNVTREARGAFSYYYARHVLKWQNDVGRVEVQSGLEPPARTWELRSQLQFVF